MGLTYGKKRGLLLGDKYQRFWQKWACSVAGLLVEARVEDGDQEVREVGSAFIHL